MDEETTFIDCPACRGQLTSDRKDPATGWKPKCERCDGLGVIKVPVTRKH
jgi:DnaJ-class molecular chaperone